MQVSITQFRRDVFALMNQALEGHDLWITHKGQRLRVIPEARPNTRLARLTPLDVVASDAPAADASLQEEMTRAWERDWATL